jgi:phosphate-selective porin OprO and OprP
MKNKTILLLALTMMIITDSLAQQDTVIRDGTQGEMLEVLNTDSSENQYKDKRWRLFKGRISTFKFGAGFLYEYAGFASDENAKIQMDSLGTPLEGKFKVRDFRLLASGQFNTKRVFTWKIGLMYDATLDAWLLRESGFMVDVPEIKSSFFLGRTKEGFSMNKVMNGYFGWGFERQMALDVIPILADGIKWLGYIPKKKIFWNTGIYVDWLSEGQSFSTYQWQYALRAGWLPIQDTKGNRTLHIGFNYRYGKVAGGQIQLRSKPEANPAPYFISTGKFISDHSNHIGYELYYRTGKWMIGSEYYWTKFSSPKEGDPMFHGGEIVATWLINGTARPYNPNTAIFGFVPVNKSIFKGGIGTFEAVLRYSTLDLNGGNIKGGKMWRITPMVNWYMSKVLRFELGYGYGVLDRYEIKGGTHFFQSRIQITFL